MLLILIFTAITLPICWISVRWFQIKNYWKYKGVPHQTPHPVLGSLTFMLKKNPALWMREMYDHFRSPYVGIWLFWRPALIINSPEIARRVLVKDSAIFRDRFLSSGTTDPIGALNLFTLKDPLWSIIRRRLTGMFTASKLRQSYTYVALKSKELVYRIKLELEKDKRINLRSIFSDYTTDVVGTTAFGIASDATITGEGPLRTVTNDFMKFSIFRGMCWASIFFFPELVDTFGFSLFPKPTTDFFRKIYLEIIAQRGGYEVEVADTQDMIDMLRKVKQDFNKDHEDISEDTLIAQAAIFLQAGFDTTSATLSFCIYELAYHPDMQNILHEELIEAKQKNGNKDFDSSDLNNCIYLNCVMKETLRKYGAMGWLDRIASKDYQIDENLLIKRGTPVYVNAIGMQYDPDFFPEPLKFKPDRFMPCNAENITPFSYMPFGEGPRICIGKRFAIQNFTSALSSLILNYKISPIPNAPLPSDVQIEKKGLLLLPGEQLYVEFTHRN